MIFNIEDVNELIRLRRSSFPRQYAAGKKVPDEIIGQMLENANWAPSHKQTEPWRFTVFTGEGLKQFAAFQANRYKATAGPAFAGDKYEKLLSNPLRCSHIISIGMKRHAGNGLPEVEEIAAVACAVQNMHLTATAYQLGCYWTTGGVTYDESAKAFFGLGASDKLLGFFYVGVIAVPSPMGKRGPVTEKVNWVRQ
jgi:nitroreductase